MIFFPTQEDMNTPIRVETKDGKIFVLNYSMLTPCRNLMFFFDEIEEAARYGVRVSHHSADFAPVARFMRHHNDAVRLMKTSDGIKLEGREETATFTDWDNKFFDKRTIFELMEIAETASSLGHARLCKMCEIKIKEKTQSINTGKLEEMKRRIANLPPDQAQAVIEEIMGEEMRKLGLHT